MGRSSREWFWWAELGPAPAPPSTATRLFREAVDATRTWRAVRRDPAGRDHVLKMCEDGQRCGGVQALVVLGVDDLNHRRDAIDAAAQAGCDLIFARAAVSD